MSKSKSRTFKNAAYAHLAEIGKALSSSARLKILELLGQLPRDRTIVVSVHSTGAAGVLA